MPHFIDRAKPGVIAVTRHGHRFVNESLSYHDFAIAMMQACQDDDEATVWLLCDHATLRRYGLGRVAPFPVPYGRHLRAGYLRRAPTIAALAAQIGVDPRVLAAEVERFNRDASNGADTAFGKGTTAYNRFQGDALHGPNPAWRRSNRRRTTRSSCSSATSARSPGCPPTHMARCCIRTAAPPTACTRWATTRPASWAAITPARASPWGPRSRSATSWAGTWGSASQPPGPPNPPPRPWRKGVRFATHHRHHAFHEMPDRPAQEDT